MISFLHQRLGLQLFVYTHMLLGEKFRGFV